MATLLLSHRDTIRHIPLAAASLVGRASGCLVRVDDTGIPSHWLELRWAAGGWRWRALAGAERTRGVGMLAEDGWRTLPPSSPGRPQRIRLDDLASVELEEGGAPVPFLLNLHDGSVRSDEAMDEIVELREDGRLIPFHAEGAAAAALTDGDVVVHEGRAWRAHLPTPPEATQRVRIDLGRPGASIDVDPQALRATVHQGEVDVTITGEHVRVLIAYALAARDDANGGWLTAEEAWASWRALGGNPQSPIDRIGWDRGRCRSQLSRAGVGGVDGLFEARRMHGRPEVRITTPIE